MGLGKTITCVSLMAATLLTAREFSKIPLPPIPNPPSQWQHASSSLSASHFAGSVWGMPDVTVASDGNSVKKKAQLQKEHDKWEAECARARRLKVRSRATLIICPLSTVVNWEDQFREHWTGEVQIVGGAGLSCNSSLTTTAGSSSRLQSSSTEYEEPAPCADSDEAVKTTAKGQGKAEERLKVYIYHGNARRPDPNFLADFDAVITTYATLASEFSRQTKSLAVLEADDDDDEFLNGSMDVQTDENGNQIINIPEAKDKKSSKRKKNLASIAVEVSSALQSIHWFRVVLDEAQYVFQFLYTSLTETQQQLDKGDLDCSQPCIVRPRSRSPAMFDRHTCAEQTRRCLCFNQVSSFQSI